MAEYYTDEEYIFKAEFNEDYGLQFMPTGELVRCKDCIHYDLGVCLKIYSDGNAQKDSWQSRNPNDFCSYGERKDGGADNASD